MFKNVISGLEKAMVGSATGFPCPSCGACQSRNGAGPDTVLTCRSCGYFASAMEWAAKARDGMATGRAGHPPAGTRISREGSGSFRSWNIPPSGKSGGLLFFGWFWCAFTLLFTCVFLPSVVLGKASEVVKSKSGELPGWAAVLFIVVFLSIFWSVGLAMLYFGYRGKNTSHRVSIGGGIVTLMREWRGRKERSIPLSEVKSIGQVVFYTRNYKPVHGIEIRGSSGKLRFGGTLDEAEKAWLVEEFRQAVWPQDGKPSAGAVPTARGVSRDVFSIPFPKAGAGIVGSVVGLLVSGAFVVLGWKVFPILSGGGPPPFFRWLWMAFSGFVFLGILSAFIRQILNRDVEQRLDGTAAHLAFRKVKKGMTLSERLFDRSKYRDIRATSFGTSNGREMKRVELILGDKAERLASWVEAGEADAFVQEVRRVMG